MLNENEIRPHQLMPAQADFFAADVARLLQFQDEFISVPCPACEEEKFSILFQKNGVQFVQCTACETWYANPRPLPHHLDFYYQHSENYRYWSQFIFPASENARREKIFKPRVQRVLSLCKQFDISANSLLEVGAGFGLFCEEVQKNDFFKQVIALEPTPDLAAHCRSKHLTVVEKTIEMLSLQDLSSKELPVSVIVGFEVIEHLFSPRNFLLKCWALLEEGGLLILTCPNSKGFDIVTLREQSSAVDLEHLNLFNLNALANLMINFGFEVVNLQTPGQLDAELVRNAFLEQKISVQNHPFLKQLLLDHWEQKGAAFQQFLIQNQLSSHMWVTARKVGNSPEQQNKKAGLYEQ